MGGQTTLVQQSAARTTHSSHSDSQGGAGSVATPTQSTLGPQGKKTVNTRDQSLPGDNSSVTTTEDQTTREGIRADVKPKVFVQASTKWVKGVSFEDMPFTVDKTNDSYRTSARCFTSPRLTQPTLKTRPLSTTPMRVRTNFESPDGYLDVERGAYRASVHCEFAFLPLILTRE